MYGTSVAPILLVLYGPRDTRFVVGIRPLWEFEQSSNGRRRTARRFNVWEDYTYQHYYGCRLDMTDET